MGRTGSWLVLTLALQLSCASEPPRAPAQVEFITTTDGQHFTPVNPEIETIEAGDTLSYGYWQPVLYRLDVLPEESRYLRMQFVADGVRVSRVELAYGS